MEVVVSGTDESTLRAHLPGDQFRISSTPAGLQVELNGEAEVDIVIAALRKAGGKLVSVQPVRQSLEELFLDGEQSVTV